jgi:hypothetical protein
MPGNAGADCEVGTAIDQQLGDFGVHAFEVGQGVEDRSPVCRDVQAARAERLLRADVYRVDRVDLPDRRRLRLREREESSGDQTVSASRTRPRATSRRTDDRAA